MSLFVSGALFFLSTCKGGAPMKDNRYATNAAGVIKAPKSVKDSPKATVVKGEDLRNGKKSK
jgi:hypothetical protein